MESAPAGGVREGTSPEGPRGRDRRGRGRPRKLFSCLPLTPFQSDLSYLEGLEQVLTVVVVIVGVVVVVVLMVVAVTVEVAVSVVVVVVVMLVVDTVMVIIFPLTVLECWCDIH